MGSCSLKEELKKQAATDTEKQQLLKRLNFSTKESCCLSSKPAVRLCQDILCESHPLICSQQDCLSCSQSHKSCRDLVELELMNLQLQKRSENQKKILKKLYQLQDQISDKVKQRREKGLQKIVSSHLDQNNNLLKEIFSSLPSQHIKGRDCANLLQTITALNNQLEESTQKVIKRVKGEIKSLEQMLIDIENEVYYQLMIPPEVQPWMMQNEKHRDLELIMPWRFIKLEPIFQNEEQDQLPSEIFKQKSGLIAKKLKRKESLKSKLKSQPKSIPFRHSS